MPRDNFSKEVIDHLAKRASYICSNPCCHSHTICPSSSDSSNYILIGEAAHITAASPGGARYDNSLTPEQRSSIENAIFLCSSCADMIDKNNGQDYSVDVLKKWKREHEQWVRDNLNKSVSSPVTVVDGEHRASGTGIITALDIRKPTIIKPGTKSIASGEGNITATKIS